MKLQTIALASWLVGMIAFIYINQPTIEPKQTSTIRIIKQGVETISVNGQVVSSKKWIPPVEPEVKPEVKELVKTEETDVEQLIRKYFGKDAETAIKVATLESGLDPNAEGDLNTRYHSIGVFQIRLLPDRGLTVEEMKNPEHNIAYAKMLYDKSGWNPWLNTKKKLNLK